MNEATYRKRLERCAVLMRGVGFDALLLTKPANMFYLTGDGRLCAYALISSNGKVALGVPATDVEDVERRAVHDMVSGFKDEVGMIHSIARHFERFDIAEGSVGLEYSYLTHSMMHMLTHPHAKPASVQAGDATHLLSELRIVKEEGEIDRIRSAAAAASAGMAAAARTAKPGATESMVAASAEYEMRASGADGFWRTYVSSGPRTNMAHGLPTSRKLEEGDLVMIDLHPVVDGYSADLCRTAVAGKASRERRTAFELYRTAQQACIERARTGTSVTELERAMHGVLKDAGMGEHIFGPPIHGVGIEFEEAPLPAGHAFFHGEKEPSPLRANVVIAVGNCGLYTGPWGVRVEDTLVVRDTGPEVLTAYPKDL